MGERQRRTVEGDFDFLLQKLTRLELELEFPRSINVCFLSLDRT
jgi:hypothetical protein